VSAFPANVPGVMPEGKQEAGWSDEFDMVMKHQEAARESSWTQRERVAEKIHETQTYL
jgi:hypothetical protein